MSEQNNHAVDERLVRVNFLVFWIEQDHRLRGKSIQDGAAFEMASAWDEVFQQKFPGADIVAYRQAVDRAQMSRSNQASALTWQQVITELTNTVPAHCRVRAVAEPDAYCRRCLGSGWQQVTWMEGADEVMGLEGRAYSGVKACGCHEGDTALPDLGAVIRLLLRRQAAAWNGQDIPDLELQEKAAARLARMGATQTDVAECWQWLAAQTGEIPTLVMVARRIAAFWMLDASESLRKVTKNASAAPKPPEMAFAATVAGGFITPAGVDFSALQEKWDQDRRERQAARYRREGDWQAADEVMEDAA